MPGLCQGVQRAKGQMWAVCLAWASGWAQCVKFPGASLCVFSEYFLFNRLLLLSHECTFFSELFENIDTCLS